MAVIGWDATLAHDRLLARRLTDGLA